jgi:hypothetical protein
MPGGHVDRPVNPECVVIAARETPHTNVPDVKRLVQIRIEPDFLNRFQRAIAVEEQQRDLGRFLREQREIDAFRARHRSERMRRTRFDRK